MEKNTQTVIRQLQTGDRFYRVTDTKRTVWEMVDGGMKKTHFRHYHYWAKTDVMTKPQPVDGSTKVVFLRHTNNR